MSIVKYRAPKKDDEGDSWSSKLSRSKVRFFKEDMKSIEKSNLSHDIRPREFHRLKTGNSSKSGSKHSSTRNSKQNIPVLNFNKINFHNVKAFAGPGNTGSTYVA